MALETINKIKDAENEAKIKLANAAVCAEELVQQAHNQAEKMLEDAKVSALEQSKKIKRETTEIADKKSAEIALAWNESTKKLTDESNDNVAAAVELVINEIIISK